MKVLALDIGGTSIKAGMIDEGVLYDKREQPSEGALGGEYVLKNLFQLMDQYTDYDTVGISTTGFVNSDTGTVAFENENIPGYKGICFRQLVMDRYGKPCFLENDVNAAAIGEAYYGAGKDLQDFLCLTYGTGIGGAIIINRRLYKGPGGLSGEFGHMITHARGNLCNCGNQGCYESYASTTALVRNAMSYRSSLCNGRAIFTEAMNGDPEILSIIDDWIDEIAYGLISLVHIFSPSHILLGGGIMQQSYILERLQKKIPTATMDGFQNITLLPTMLGNDAGIYGMAAIASLQ